MTDDKTTNAKSPAPDPGLKPLPRAVLAQLVEHHLARREDYLRALEDRPSPVYLFEPAALERRAATFREAFARTLPAVSCYFAVKSNNHPGVARTLVGAGFGLDVSSGMELELALAARCRDIVFSGPGKTDAELGLAAAFADRVTVLVDSFGELHRLERAAAERDETVRIGVRLTTEPGGLWRKFGIALEELPAFRDSAAQAAHVRLAGLQFHTSWSLDPRRQVRFIERIGEALRRAPATLIDALEFVDIGGGYWPEVGEWLRAEEPLDHRRRESVPIETFAAAIGAAVREQLRPLTRCRICLEPGRWICDEAMHLLLTVVDRKAPDLVVTDAGTSAIGWERYEVDYCPIINLSRPSTEERACDVLGSLCTPHDVWGASYFGEDIRPGDVLLIPNQGAYTYSLRQQFIKPAPAVVVI